MQAERLVRAGLHNHRLKDGLVGLDEFGHDAPGTPTQSTPGHSRRESLGDSSVLQEVLEADLAKGEVGEVGGPPRGSAASPIPQQVRGAESAIPRRHHTGLKRVSSEACLSGSGSSLLSMASTIERDAPERHSAGRFGARGGTESWAENLSELGFGFGGATLSAYDSVGLDHSAALTASFHNYFRRLSDEAIKRTLARKRKLGEGAARPTAPVRTDGGSLAAQDEVCKQS